MHDNLDFSKYKGFCQKQSLWGLISLFGDLPCYQNILQTYSYLQNLHPHAAPVLFNLVVWAGGRGQYVGQDVGCPGCQFLHPASSWLLKSYNCLFFGKVIILRLFPPNSCQLSQELWKYIFGISASLSDWFEIHPTVSKLLSGREGEEMGQAAQVIGLILTQKNC